MGWCLPSWNTSSPWISAVYMPTYSCRSVCSWLLIRRHLCPVALAKYCTRLVFPAEVGPCSSTGYLLGRGIIVQQQLWDSQVLTTVDTQCRKLQSDIGHFWALVAFVRTKINMFCQTVQAHKHTHINVKPGAVCACAANEGKWSTKRTRNWWGNTIASARR